MNARLNRSLGTPLHCAAWNGYTEIARELLANGALIDEFSCYLKTPLHYAAGRQHCVTAPLLIEYGANRALKDKDGYIPLAYLQDKVEGSRLLSLPTQIHNKTQYKQFLSCFVAGFP